MQETNKKGTFIKILNVIRYLLGSFLILGSITDLPNFYGFIGILTGISLYPIIFNKISKVVKVDIRKVLITSQIVLPIILFITWGCLLPNTTSDLNNSEHYTFEFYSDGKQIEKIKIDEGKKLKEPEAPAKDGYKFSHWATHEHSVDGSEIYDFSVIPIKSNTLFAHYEVIEDNSKDTETSNPNNNDPKPNTNNNNNSKPNTNNNNNSKPNTNTNNNNNSNNNSKPSSNTNNSTNSQTNSNQNIQQKPSDNTPSVSVSKQNALKSAKSYLGVSAFSRSGLIEQLEYEKFSNEDAVYAVDNCAANWNEQALKSAKSYLRVSAFSRSGLIGQLEYEGFTNSQASYGVSNCGANWNEQAAKSAKSYLNVSAFSRDGLIEQLEYEGFTHEQAVYGVSQNGL